MPTTELSTKSEFSEGRGESFSDETSCVEEEPADSHVFVLLDQSVRVSQ